MYRVLHVVNSLNINAGQMSVAMNYYRFIDREKIQFDFLYFQELPEDHKDENHKDEIENLGGRYYTLGKPSFFGEYQKKLKAFFKEHRGEYIAVHCHPIWAAEIVANAAKKYGIAHVIAHSHSTKFSDKKISAVRNRILMQFMGGFATDYISCSPEAAYLFGKRRVRNNQVMVLKNAIDCSKYVYKPSERERIRNEFSISEHTCVIGNVGRLCIQKNQAFLLEIYQELLKILPDSMLLIAGDGELRQEIENRIFELNLTDHVVLAGKRKDISAIYSAMDIFVMPSLFEGAPVAAIEAQANGLICLMSTTITRSVQLNLGHYCDLEVSAKDWAEKIIMLLESNLKIDRNDQKALIDNGFDIKHEAKILEEYYLSISEESVR